MSLYSQLMTFRNFLYDRGVIHSESAKLPTVVVGNLTVGGNGKSPISEMICRVLEEQGHRPVILLRGYGGRIVSPHLVEGVDSAKKVGDEALMHFRAGFRVVVSPDRLAGCHFIAAKGLGDIVVLDDGLQHRALRPTVSLALFDKAALVDVSRGRYLPFGRLREAVIPALRRVSAVVLVERGEDLSRPDWVPDPLPCFRASLTLGELRSLSGETMEYSQVSSAIALSSLAKPEQFEQMLELKGVQILESVRGRDHQRWSEAELMRLDERPGDVIITTAKDAVKLESLTLPRKKIFAASLTAELPEEFKRWLLDKL
jgi:tetraacyldisaccharide 4'-kinase